METLDPPRAPASGSSARRRLEGLRQYAGLVIRQARALERGDLDSFQELAEERAGVQASLEEASGGSLETGGTPELAELVSGVRAELEAASEADAAIVEELGRLRRETANEIRSVEDREPKLRRYLEEDGPGGVGRSRINIRL